MLVFAAAAMLVLYDGTASAQRGKNGGTAIQSLSVEEAATLSFMREEEKLARDVYQVMFDTWGATIFENIAASEQRHMDALLNLLAKYNLPDPALGPGAFSPGSGLQEIYDGLITLGSQSLESAMQVGVMIEVLDIHDLQEAMAGTTRTDLLNVYGNLLSGSENHLAAFTAHLE
jgi:hypothetical protein